MFTLSTTELLQVANDLGLRDEAIGLATAQYRLAQGIAAKLGIAVASRPDPTLDGYEAFFPATPGQPLPEALEGFDNAEEWGE